MFGCFSDDFWNVFGAHYSCFLLKNVWQLGAIALEATLVLNQIAIGDYSAQIQLNSGDAIISRAEVKVWCN